MNKLYETQRMERMDQNMEALETMTADNAPQMIDEAQEEALYQANFNLFESL